MTRAISDALAFSSLGKSYHRTLWTQTPGNYKQKWICHHLNARKSWHCSWVQSTTWISPATAEVWKPLRKLMSVKAEWAWNGTYQDVYDKAKKANDKRCMHDIFQCFKAIVPRDRCIWHRPWSWFIADGKGHELRVWWTSRQYDPLPNCLCQ